jgi:hypothetical protein
MQVIVKKNLILKVSHFTERRQPMPCAFTLFYAKQHFINSSHHPAQLYLVGSSR